MIDTRELKLGNYLKKEGVILKVTSFSSSLINVEIAGANILYVPSELDPIPLTEEVLLKCGLTRKGSFFGMGFLDTIYWYNIENQILYIEYTDSPFSEDEGVRYPISSPIKHLHTLMNAIYDLTGKELEYE